MTTKTAALRWITATQSPKDPRLAHPSDAILADPCNGTGYYLITREDSYVVYNMAGGEERTEPCKWAAHWHPYAAPGTRVVAQHLTTSADIDEAKRAIADHYTAAARATAWQQYMKDNDPPA